MRDKPALLIIITFYTTLPMYIPPLPRHPATICRTCTEPFHTITPYLMIRLCLPLKCHSFLFPSHITKHSTDTPVRISILQRFRKIIRRISLLIIAKCADCVQRIFQSFPDIIIPDTFIVSIRHHRNGRITHHTTRIGIQEFPTWKIFLTAQFRQLNQ